MSIKNRVNGSDMRMTADPSKLKQFWNSLEGGRKNYDMPAATC